MKGDFSRSYSKNKKNTKIFQKNCSQLEFDCFIVNFPVRSELVLLVSFRLLGTPN